MVRMLGQHRGNRVFKLDPATGRLSITIPNPVADTQGLGPVREWAAGYVLTLAAPVSFTLHGVELADRLNENFGVRFDLEPRYQSGKLTRVYLRASWTREQLPPPAHPRHRPGRGTAWDGPERRPLRGRQDRRVREPGRRPRNDPAGSGRPGEPAGR